MEPWIVKVILTNTESRKEHVHMTYVSTAKDVPRDFEEEAGSPFIEPPPSTLTGVWRDDLEQVTLRRVATGLLQAVIGKIRPVPKSIFAHRIKSEVKIEKR